jgi:DNA polymerase
MNPDPESLLQYLDQTLQLYGKYLFLENTEHDDMATINRDLDSYHHSICNCQKCPLGKTRQNFVFGVGNPQADIVLVGEAPGAQEDLQGLPFVGRAGKLLDKMLAAIELTRDDIYICNVLKCRPPKNRDPLPAEVELCEPYLIHQLHLIQPKLIVALGRISACTILKTKESLKNLRNKTFQYTGIDLLVTYHPMPVF